MGIGISIFVGAVGAILRYAVTGPANQQGFNIHTGGIILMMVGGLGLLLSMLFWSSFAPFGRRDQSASRTEETITQDGHEQGRIVRETRDHVAS
jgi:fluoride ion exporter CrcB/FEX